MLIYSHNFKDSLKHFWIWIRIRPIAVMWIRILKIMTINANQDPQRLSLYILKKSGCNTVSSYVAAARVNISFQSESAGGDLPESVESPLADWRIVKRLFFTLPKQFADLETIPNQETSWNKYLDETIPFIIRYLPVPIL